jgi:hypothetical protein
MTARTACCVPFCARSTKGVWAEWLCSDHWKLVDRSLKALRTRSRRRWRKRGEIEDVEQDGSKGYRLTRRRAWRVDRGYWRRMVRQAIERASGISA